MDGSMPLFFSEAVRMRGLEKKEIQCLLMRSQFSGGVT